MTRTFASLILVFIVLALGLMFFAVQSGSAVVLEPSELQSSSDEIPRLRVVGRVEEGSINYQTEPNIELSFSIRDPGTDSSDATVEVTYRGLKPDMFAPGRDVIVDGRYKNGQIEASSLLTQCPSKYEAPMPEESEQS